MERDYCCVSIPLELSAFRKVQKNVHSVYDEIECDLSPSFKVCKSEKGAIEAIEYACADNVTKKIFYNGSTVIKTEYYKFGELYLIEEFKDEKIAKKLKYNASKLASETSYRYDNRGKLTKIIKQIGNEEFYINFGYDDIGRINSKKIYYNSQLVYDQFYKFDILDRISEYKDLNQHIKIHKMDRNNKLVSYTIIDKNENTIQITNYFNASYYNFTEIELNGHKTTLKDVSYVDNVMLKKPRADEDDIDLIISGLRERNTTLSPTTRNQLEAAFQRSTHCTIDSSIKGKALPISQRKRNLFFMISKS